MRWPERPTCHDNHRMRHLDLDMKWRPPETTDRYTHPFRTCSFCGSIHPEDLVGVLPKVPETRKITPSPKLNPRGIVIRNVEVADWKYGYPHKVYIHGIPNPNEGRTIQIGTDHKGGVETPLYAKEGGAWAKFYTKHLLDDGFDGEAMQSITEALLERTGIEFFVRGEGENKSLHWRVMKRRSEM